MQEQEIRKSLRLDSERYYQTHLALINCLLPVEGRMTEKEIEVLGIFMSFENELALHRFGPTGRKIVMKKAKISPSGLSNYIGFLENKGVLIKVGDVYTINPKLDVNSDTQYYRFRLIKNVETANTNNNHVQTEETV